MKTFKELLESLETVLDLKRNPEFENAINTQYYPHTLTNVEVYDANHNGIPYHFARFKHKGMWEVHFGNFNDPTNARLNVHKGAGASHLIGTAIHLYKEKLDKNQPVRFYGGDDKLHKFYKTVMSKISRQHYNGKLHYNEVRNFKSVDGSSLPAIEIHVGDPTPKLNKIIEKLTESTIKWKKI